MLRHLSFKANNFKANMVRLLFSSVKRHTSVVSLVTPKYTSLHNNNSHSKFSMLIGVLRAEFRADKTSGYKGLTYVTETSSDPPVQ